MVFNSQQREKQRLRMFHTDYATVEMYSLFDQSLDVLGLVNVEYSLP